MNFIDLGIAAYYLSKFMLLSTIGAAQSTLSFAVVRPWCRPEASPLSQRAILSGLAAAGTSIGLLISAAARTEGSATGLVPIAIIPQIILAGVIAPLRGPSKWLSDMLVTERWGQQALADLVPRPGPPGDDDSWFRPMAFIIGHAAVAAALTIFALDGTRRP